MYFKASLLEIILSYLLIYSTKIVHYEVETVLEENSFDFRSLEQQTFIFVCSKVFCLLRSIGLFLSITVLGP